MPVATPGGSLIDGSGTLTTGGVAQEVFAENNGRQYLLIQNISDITLWIDFGGDAVQDQPSIQLVAGAALEFAAGNTGVVPTASVSIIGATTGKSFVAKQA